MFPYRFHQLEMNLFDVSPHTHYQLEYISRALSEHQHSDSLTAEIDALKSLFFAVEDFLVSTALDEEDIKARRKFNLNKITKAITDLTNAITTAEEHAKSHTDTHSTEYKFFISGLHYFCEYVRNRQSKIQPNDIFFKPLKNSKELNNALKSEQEIYSNNTPRPSSI